MLARCKYHPSERHHAFLADCLSDHGERLLSDFPIRDDVVGAVQVQLVDLLLRHELVDLNRPPALYGDCLKLFGLDLDVLALAHLISLHDLGRIDFIIGLGIHLAVLDAIAGILVDLVEADFFPFA
jgi:hypothetical protein